MKLNQLYIDAALKLLDPTHRDLAPEVGARGYTAFEIKSIDEAARTVTAFVSTPNPDRYEEIVLPEAFAKWLPMFLRNPVLCAGHQYIGPAGEPTVIGHWLDIQITAKGPIGTCQFMSDDPLAEKWWQRFRQRSVRAFSVGWITHAWEMRKHKLASGAERTLRTFTEVELIEISAVAIPANRESLVRAAAAALGAGAGAGPGADQINKAVAAAIAEQLKSFKGELLAEIAKTLTDPDGPVDAMFRAVVDAHVHAPGSHGHDHDDPEADPDESAKELKAHLQRTLEAAGVR
jgi:HK97 family phage prohead protease